jgi:hypothetical protein
MPPKYALVLVFLQSSDFLAPWEKTVVQNKAAATTRILYHIYKIAGHNKFIWANWMSEKTTFQAGKA